jgi:hypothetical protein
MEPFACKLWAALVGASLFALVAGCTASSATSQNCVPSPCGNGNTLNVCTTEDSNHVCLETKYDVGSQSFACNSCQDCATASSQAAQACAAGPGDGGGDGGGDGSNGTTCATADPCGTKGTYQECTTAGADGQCSQIVYKTSDGHTFTCAGCSCSSAAVQLANYCAGTGDTTACGTSVTCGTGGLTYSECTTSSGSACVSVEYQVSNGATYDCASCTDCSAALQQVDTFCASQGNPTTTCGASSECGTGGLTYSECTTTSSTGSCESVAYEVSDGTSYTCASCSDCTNAYDQLNGYCASQDPTTTCGSSVTCGATGVTYSECTTSSGSTCDSIAYETTDGNTFTCASCSDCTAATESLDSYCASLDTTTSCATALACGSTETYSECTTTTGGVCSSIYYQASDGTTYDCASCSDCTVASEDMTSYCADLPATTCGAAIMCDTFGFYTYSVCTTTQNGVCTSVTYEATSGQDYSCASCSDCTTAASEMTTYCAGI